MGRSSATQPLRPCSHSRTRSKRNQADENDGSRRNELLGRRVRLSTCRGWRICQRRIQEPVDINFLAADIRGIPRLTDNKGVDERRWQLLQMCAQRRIIRQAIESRRQPVASLGEALHERIEVCCLVELSVVAFGYSLGDQVLDGPCVASFVRS